MAVPKKRTSKSKSGKQRWKGKSVIKCNKYLSLAKSMLTGKSNSFVYIDNEIQ